MLGWLRIYCKVLDLPLKILVKSKSIPTKPLLELGLDVSRPIMYVMLNNSIIDLLTLRTQCLAHNLPDPLNVLEISGAFLPRFVFVYNRSHRIKYCTLKKESTELFHNYLDLHRNNPNLDVQMIPVYVMFGRQPGRQKSKKNPSRCIFGTLEKFFSISWLGRDSFVRFSSSVSLRRMTDKYGTDKFIAKKLARLARIHFTKQLLAAVGPKLPNRKDLFNKLLHSKAIMRAVVEEAKIKKIPYKKAKENAVVLMKEITANFSYEMVRLFDRILSFTWNRLYQRINVHNIERVRSLASNGHEIIHIPCHRSHMDYLLLSYVLYHQGLVPPHIVAGINLNFWPAGPIFRRLGAFFIYRTFKGNKLYSAIFREYLGELFARGYSIEYFIEGGRSRTGRLLDPKTGILSMAIQAMLRGTTRPITLVPIYIGYEHVMEVKTYAKELCGAKKEKENLLKMLQGLSQLRNLGQSYVNFSEPMQLTTWLNLHVPKWRDSSDSIEKESPRPAWLTPIANSIASELMIRINNAAAANAMNLCCTALLASRQYSLTRNQLIEQLECYLNIMRNAPYSTDATIPNATATQLIDHAIQMNKFEIEKNEIIGDIITLPRQQAILMTYYRNNISHMLILPSLIATILTRYKKITRQKLFQYIELLYPMLKSELFLRWKGKEVTEELDKLITELFRQNLLTFQNQQISINPLRYFTLQLLAASANETLQRYAITFWLLSNNPSFTRLTLKKKSQKLAQRLSVFLGINPPEFFDKAVFNSLVLTLDHQGYICCSTCSTQLSKTLKVYQILSELITSDVRLMIESVPQDELC